MEQREILIYYSIKYEGDWDRIFEAINQKEEPPKEDVEKCIRDLKSKVLTIFDNEYPAPLKMVCKPPFVLFYHGNLDLIKDYTKIVSVVGSRECSEYGETVTKYFVSALAKDVVIVSGMARGIDQIAHRACLESGGKTIAVLPCGINVCYPPSSLDIYDIVKKNHLLISEYPDLTQPVPALFPIRNRIIAGLSRCLLIPEGKMNSGTSITATVAAECGSEICCVPSQIGTNSLTNHLIAYGANLVETPDEVLYAMDFKKEEPIFEK